MAGNLLFYTTPLGSRFITSINLRFFGEIEEVREGLILGQ